VAGAHIFDDVPVYIHKADLPLLRGDEVHGAWPVELAELWLGRPPLPPDLRSVVDGDCVRVSSAEFCAVHLPGHTPGSVGWHYRDLLFSGDGLLIGRDDAQDLILLPSPEYPAASAAHLRRVQPMNLQLVLDGHWGWLGDVGRKVQDALAQYQREFAGGSGGE
jgi:glyoxylase-like metal-dependent hydrolase (beta-lactamase superfamily II)